MRSKDNQIETRGKATRNLFTLPHLVDAQGPKTKGRRLYDAAQDLLTELEAGRALTAKTLRAAVTANFDDRTDADGAWSWKDAYEAAEGAVVLFIQRYGNAMTQHGGRPRSRAEQLARIRRLEALEPSETIRNETQLRLQQFSTPLSLALAVQLAADIHPADVVLEPSAGTGFLAALGALKLRADQKGRLHLNELGEIRKDLLQALFPHVAVSQLNAEQLADRRPNLRPSIVVMNPPFSRTPGIDGQWRHADTRHVRSAYQMLQPGGRLVTITSERCRPHEQEWRNVFHTCNVHPRIAFTCAVAGRVYSRHGTTFDCRLTILDKPTPAQELDSIIDQAQRAEDVGSLIDLLTRRLPPRLNLESATPRRRSRTPGPVKRQSAQARRLTERENHTWGPCEELKYTPIDRDIDEGPAAETSGAYQAWTAETIDIPHASAHPTALVQSRAMAAVRHPIASYRPKLPLAITEEAKLSAAQLESVVLAGQAGLKHLERQHLVSDNWDTSFPVNDEGVPLNEDWDKAKESGQDFNLEPVRFRQGWMLGDGTGTGKGRQVTAIILDNWLRGRKRALWLSQSDKLVEDARRDWLAVGGLEADIIPVSRIKQGEPIKNQQGILFATYATLRSVSRQGKIPRLHQMVNWLADGTSSEKHRQFQGAIVFDESHAMANAAGGKGSRGKIKPSAQGLAGLKLQNALPDARIIYVSATGATTTKGLAYAKRLGLWGAQMTPFEKREDFITAMTVGGVAAMEIVARDLKALGLYQARALSYEGVEIEILEHTLTEEQTNAYNEYADAFQIIHKHLHMALEASGVTHEKNGKIQTLNPNAKGAAIAAFESTKQRFFNHMLTGMKMPTLIKAVQEDIENGRAPVVQLVSTGEALMERRILQVPPSEWEDLTIDLTPREYVMEYLLHAFPTQLYEEYTNEEGDLAARPVVDSDGQAVESQAALRERDELVEKLGGLPPVQSALDQLIQVVGHDTVAEISGRKRRILRIDDGNGCRMALRPRAADSNLSEANAFMEGEKKALVFSMAGAIGRSYHASKTCKNQDRRVHYLLETGWRADQAIQGLGRSHRTHQASAPIFRPVSTNVKGERRFISTIAKRLDSLGALTRGQRNSQTTMGDNDEALFKASDNFESVYAHRALNLFYIKLWNKEMGDYTLKRFQELTGLKLLDNDGNLNSTDDLPEMYQFLNRLLALRIQDQNALFEELEQLLASNIEQAMEAGTYNQGVEEIFADSVNIRSRENLYTDRHTSAETELIELSLREKSHPMTAEAAEERLHAGGRTTNRNGLKINTQSKRPAIAITAPSWFQDDGRLERRVYLLRPNKRESMSESVLNSSNWEAAPKRDWKRAWNHEIETTPEYREQRIWLVSGLLLPIWDRLPEASMRVRRITTDDGQPLIGRTLMLADVNKTREAFGCTEALELSAQEVWTEIWERGSRFQLTKDVSLCRRRVMGIDRLEIANCFGQTLENLKRMGCRTEVIYHQTRAFAPNLEVLARVLKQYPLRSGRA